jgi:hypothetical protein
VRLSLFVLHPHLGLTWCGGLVMVDKLGMISSYVASCLCCWLDNTYGFCYCRLRNNRMCDVSRVVTAVIQGPPM